MSGKHLIIDYHGCRQIPRMEEMYNLLNSLVRAIDMTPLTAPYVMRGAPHDPGLTGAVIIEQSHITFHSFDLTRDISFDLYSCKDFDEVPVIKTLDDKFKPSERKVNVLIR